MNESSHSTPGEDQDLVITRIFDAPREFVFKAWAEPERVMRWFGPKGFTIPVYKADFHPGGRVHNCMRSPEGRDYWGVGVFREIVEPERIVVTDSFADEQGNVVPATHYGMSSAFPLEMLITVTFEEHDGKTKLTLQHAGIPHGEDSDMCAAGWNESFDKLDEYLADETAKMKKAA